MTTTTKNTSSNSYDYSSTKSTGSQATCNICKRLLYSFEEVLLCRLCHGSYHWRCVKPETISHYGENTQFICEKCNENLNLTTSTNRLSNGGIKIKSPDSTETDYRDFASVPSKLNATPTKDATVINTIRYFEEKQQQQQANKNSRSNEFDENYSSQINGQYTDENKTYNRIQQQQQRQTGLDIDDENTTSEMFQADYQYTPLKEYAAMRTNRISNESTTNSHQNLPTIDTNDRQSSSRYNGNLRYTSHDYEQTKSRLVETPLNSSTNFTGPTVESLSIHIRQPHYVSTTNLNVNDPTVHRQQQQQTDLKNSLHYSTPYLSQIRDDHSPTFKSSYPQYSTDRHSTVGSDSGIVMVNSQYQHQTSDNEQIIEKKLTDLVQKLGRQLETDAGKFSEKLELKLKNLENMIHQQTYIIRRQDEVIERLKGKILKIETERDHFRDRLSIHEQREHNEKKTYTSTLTDELTNRKTYETDDQQQTLDDVSTTNRKYSNASSVTTENNRPSTKKSPAPRVDQAGHLVNNENESVLSKLITNVPTNQRQSSDSLTPSTISKIVTAVPIIQKPAASSRLDHIINQSTTNNVTDSSKTHYHLADVRYQEPQENIESNQMERQYVVSTIHHDENKTELTKQPEIKTRLSVSSSSSTTSSSSTSSLTTTATATRKPISNEKPANTSTIAPVLPGRNSNLHRSLESIPRRTSQSEQMLKPSNKSNSLVLGTKPVRPDEAGPIYATPREALHPASQYQGVVKGWLRKKNLNSFLKRTERFYCVLSNNTLLMHKHDSDRTPQKVINLQGAQVSQFEDKKNGSSLDLTWPNRPNDNKHYHLYVSNPQEAEQWATGIQNVTKTVDPKKSWQQYRLNS